MGTYDWTVVDWNVPHSEASTRRLLHEIALGILITVPGGIQLVERGTISWLWFGVGVFASVLWYAASRISLGRSVNQWFERIGSSGRIAVFLFIGLSILVIVTNVSVLLTASFLVGSMTVAIIVPSLWILKQIGDDVRQ